MCVVIALIYVFIFLVILYVSSELHAINQTSNSIFTIYSLFNLYIHSVCTYIRRHEKEKLAWI
jgi:hypothetical protein